MVFSEGSSRQFLPCQPCALASAYDVTNKVAQNLIEQAKAAGARFNFKEAKASDATVTAPTEATGSTPTNATPTNSEGCL
jgi:hypothetical protein